MADKDIPTFRSIRRNVKTIVSGNKPLNRKHFDYFSVMAAIYDLHKKYPTVSFPEENFNKYCTPHNLCHYVYTALKTNRR